MYTIHVGNPPSSPTVSVGIPPASPTVSSIIRCTGTSESPTVTHIHINITQTINRTIRLFPCQPCCKVVWPRTPDIQTIVTKRSPTDRPTHHYAQCPPLWPFQSPNSGYCIHTFRLLYTHLLDPVLLSKLLFWLPCCFISFICLWLCPSYPPCRPFSILSCFLFRFFLFSIFAFTSSSNSLSSLRFSSVTRTSRYGQGTQSLLAQHHPTPPTSLPTTNHILLRTTINHHHHPQDQPTNPPPQLTLRMHYAISQDLQSATPTHTSRCYARILKLNWEPHCTHHRRCRYSPIIICIVCNTIGEGARKGIVCGGCCLGSSAVSKT